MAARDPFGARSQLMPGIEYFRLERLAELGHGDVARLPVTVKILLENLLRNAGGPFVEDADVIAFASGAAAPGDRRERAFLPARVLLQDLTGVPCVVDMAALRSAASRAGIDPEGIDAIVPTDLVVDHSVQVDAFGSSRAYAINVRREYERNHERYALLRWAQQSFHGFRVVPPGMGIVHQVNLEYLARVVQLGHDDRGAVAYPDTVVGTDSHTTMVNGIGVLGWGVGGIEAESVMLGQPLLLLEPVVVGVRLTNSMPAGTTATDLVLTLTERLRAHGVVNKFVEFCGSGLDGMSAADRATLSNMAPEYGATSALFPVDDQTLAYLLSSGRDEQHVAMVEAYHRAQGMFRGAETAMPTFGETVDLDLAGVVPSLAGPRRPQDRVSLGGVWQSFVDVHGDPMTDAMGTGGRSRAGWSGLTGAASTV
ncbi:MAG: aconitase family protein, partial [Candidatus Dormibacteria bacterium]